MLLSKELFETANPVNNYLRYAKIIAIALVIAAIGGMILYIKMQAAQLESAERMLVQSEENNKLLNDRIRTQNTSIRESNEKFELVQDLLDKSITNNAKVAEQVNKIRKDLKSQPIPDTCEAATAEMIDHSKKVMQVWKR